MALKTKKARLPGCSACGAQPRAGEPLRRGRCSRCYETWVKQKPVGLGAMCSSCGERRRGVLRQFELHTLWIVLCHNCAHRASVLAPLPRSIEGLRLRLDRDRRWGDRRAASVGGGTRVRSGLERRRDDRRIGERNFLDASELIIEMEAEFGTPAEDEEFREGPVTGIHELPAAHP